MTFYIKQNDTSPSLQYRLTDASGAPLPLSGATVTFWMGAIPHESIIEGAPVDIMDPPEDGIVDYVWAEGDTASAGRMKGEFQIVMPNGDKITAPNHGYIDIFIESDMA